MVGLARCLAGRSLLLTLAIAPPSFAVSAQTPSPASGVYVADVSEAPPELGLSSSIELRPDGCFDWRLQMGQLRLSARGSWERDGEMIRLHNPEQVGEPAVELAASARDPTDTLRISLDPSTAPMASVLEVELEYPDNQFARIALGGGAVSLPAGEERPIAVRLMSEAFTLRTQSIEIAPDGDNVLTLRLVPADLGQAFFGSQQRGFDESGMTIDWRGIAIRYNRAATPPSGD